jgi:hypothetical protein
MDVTQAATFMAGTILVSTGVVVMIAVAVLINNILHRHWKPVRLFTPDSWTAFNPPIQVAHVKEEADKKV